MIATPSQPAVIETFVEDVESWDPSRDPEAEFTYIDIASVDAESKQIVAPKRIRGADAPSRARQLVRAGDVLVSTVRPNLNAVAHVPAELDGATASTGFCVLRANRRELNDRYLFHWTRSPEFVRAMVRLATGASYPAVSDRIIRDSVIPLPPPAEQKRIAIILDKVDMIRRNRRAAAAISSEQFIPSLFRDLFGDFGSDRWDRVPVSSFVERFEGGRSIVTDDSPSSDTRYFVLKVSAVTLGQYLPRECKPAPASYDPPPEHLVRQGDLLFSRANTTELLGATAFVYETPENMLLPDKLWRFIWKNRDQVEPLFVKFLFDQPELRFEMGRRATGTSGSMKNISMDKVMSLVVPLPPPDLQRHFAKVTMQVHQLGRTFEISRQNDEQLFAALVQRAFRGEL